MSNGDELCNVLYSEIMIQVKLQCPISPVRPEIQQAVTLFFGGVVLFHPSVGYLRSLSLRVRKNKWH